MTTFISSSIHVTIFLNTIIAVFRITPGLDIFKKCIKSKTTIMSSLNSHVYWDTLDPGHVAVDSSDPPFIDRHARGQSE